MAEVEVVADDDGGDRQPVDEHPLDELLGLLVRLLLVEVDDDRGIDAGRRQQFESLLGIGEQTRRRLGPHDRRRMAIERDHRRPGIALARRARRT